MAEVYAGFSEYTDVEIGRLIDYLEASHQLDNTIVFYCADNGASGEGSPNGSVNENKFFNNYPDELSENLKYLDVLGGPETYNHYPTGWAAAFSTPYQMFKRYSEYAGGTCCPLVISWPKGIKAKGEVRNQYHHSTDIVPTILDCIGIEMPKTFRGAEQWPLSGVSMRYSFEAKPAAPTKKKRQYYAMLGTRGIWEDGWKAAALHAPLTSKGHFDKDEWELYHTDVDRSESKNVAREHPEKLKALIKAWDEEADKNMVLPLDDRSAAELLAVERPSEEGPRERYIYYPGTSPVPEGVAVNTRGRNYKIIADVEIKDKCEGVIFAHGSRFGGHSLFIKDMKLYYVYNFLGIKPEQKFASKPLKPGKYTLGMEFIRDKAGEHGESLGKTTLYVNEEVVAQGDMKTQLGKFTLSGDGLCIGRDSGDAVSEEYKTPGTFKNGTIQAVGVTVERAQYLDLEKLAAGAMAVD
jgi:arylsulfatase